MMAGGKNVIILWFHIKNFKKAEKLVAWVSGCFWSVKEFCGRFGKRWNLGWEGAIDKGSLQRQCCFSALGATGHFKTAVALWSIWNVNLKEDETEEEWKEDNGARSDGLPSQGSDEKWEEEGISLSQLGEADGYYRFLSAGKQTSPRSVWDVFVGVVRVRQGHIELEYPLKPRLPFLREEEKKQTQTCTVTVTVCWCTRACCSKARDARALGNFQSPEQISLDFPGI